MVEVCKNIYVGDDNDYYKLINKQDWCVLHCCKHPFHCQFVGYSGNLPIDHIDYAFKSNGNEMALNMVDLNFFNEEYLDYNRNMIEQAFIFLDEHYYNGKKLLIHCNQGQSRSPSLAMLYMARVGELSVDFETALTNFKSIYPAYNPKKNIFETVKRVWSNFTNSLVKGGEKNGKTSSRS